MGGNFHPGFESLSLRHFKNKARGNTSGFIIWRNRLIFTLQGDASEIAHIEEVSKHYGDWSKDDIQKEKAKAAELRKQKSYE